eukprot:Em0010g66a
MSKFATNFWGSEFCSTQGFDTLVQRLKEGKNMCIDYEEYLEKRAKVEKDYSEGLAKLVKANAGKDEIGTLRVSWDKVKKGERDRSRANYESKCKEADKAEEQCSRAQANRATKPKDLLSMQKRLEGAKLAASSADTNYQETVKALEESRQLWEREMEVLCQKFQELEEQRLTFLRNEMWTYCNLNSQSLIQVDEAYESIRKTLEECNVDQDIDLFVHEHATGTEKPASVLYINYYNSQTLPGTLGIRTLDTGTITSVPSPHVFKELPPIPDELANTGGVYTTVNEADTSTYSVPSVHHGDTLVIAVFSYEAQGDQELNLEEGDIITIISKEDDVWWCGRIGDSDQQLSFNVVVKDFSGHSYMIPATASLNVARLKQEVSRLSRLPASHFKIVFAGMKLKDDQTLADFGVTNCSTLHCVRERPGNIEVIADPSTSLPNTDLLHLPGAARDPHTAPHPDRFYVFCKRPCNQMRPGKLRVRCAQCKDGGFVLQRVALQCSILPYMLSILSLEQGPEGWEDVLTPGKLQGQCSKDGCPGRAATVSAVSNQSQCFQQYCKDRLITRRFDHNISIGYTIKCPAGCPGSEIREVHHFRVLGQELYDRYQRFGTEEFVLQMGGVLCPQANCGMGLLPEDEERRVDCPRDSGGCGFVFCRECKDAYHSGPCTRQAPVVANSHQEIAMDQAALHRAQWEERETEGYIQHNTKFCPRCKAPVEKNASVLYINYYNSQTLPGTLGIRTLDTGTITSVPSPHVFKELPPIPDELANTGGVYTTVNEADTSTYSVPSVHHGDTLVIAVFSYEAQGDQELNLEEGDIITIISKEDDVWWCGRIGDSDQQLSFNVVVKDFSGHSYMIPATASLNVARLKQEVSRLSRLPASHFKIVFAGMKLKDDQTLADFGVTNCSTLHCVRERPGNIEVIADPSTSLPNTDLLHLPGAARDPHTAPHPDRFYVFCKRPCNQMRPGKLRVRCAQCKDGGFVLQRVALQCSILPYMLSILSLEQGPEGWEDVLTPGKLQGQCSKDGCPGRAATVSAVSNQSQCFQQYCKDRLITRRFDHNISIGYTIKCPAGCPGSEIREVHHFRVLGQELYDRYQRFGTEEFVLQMGGVLCPQANCGMGLLPEDEERRVDCPRDSGGCGFVFCRECKDAYHSGPCTRQAPVVANSHQEIAMDQAALHRAQWEERETEGYIQHNTKFCPRCKAPVEKNGGCMHMTCRCRFEWCWICEIQWNGECQSSHWFG